MPDVGTDDNDERDPSVVNDALGIIGHAVKALNALLHKKARASPIRRNSHSWAGLLGEPGLLHHRSRMPLRPILSAAAEEAVLQQAQAYAREETIKVSSPSTTPGLPRRF